MSVANLKTLQVFGVSHHTATLPMREQMAFAEEQLPQVLLELKQLAGLQQVVLLSTCNRSEFYCLVQAPVENARPELLAWWSAARQLSIEKLQACTYHHQGEAAIQHLLRVASGLDSMVVGEPQILGQLKSAYHTALQAGALGGELQRWFQYGFSVAKQIRHETELGVNSVSVAAMAVKLAERIFSDIHQQQVLMVGAGQTIELVARHLIAAGVTRFTLANRTLARAQSLAEALNSSDVQCGSIRLQDLPQQLPFADIVVSSTASPLPIIGKGMIEAALKIRKNKAIFLMDLAIPRDIEAEVAELNPVFLYTIDDLQNVITEHQHKRLQAAEVAEALVIQHAQDYVLRLKTQRAASVVSRYRDKIDGFEQIALTKALLALQQGKPPEEVLRRFGHELVQKIMHEPSLQLKQAARLGRDDLLACAQQLLGIADESVAPGGADAD